MSAAELVDHLRQLTNAERLSVIEAATRLIRDDLVARTKSPHGDDPILRVAGCLSGQPLAASEIDRELYGEGAA